MKTETPVTITCRGCKATVELERNERGDVLMLGPIESWCFTNDTGWLCGECYMTFSLAAFAGKARTGEE